MWNKPPGISLPNGGFWGIFNLRVAAPIELGIPGLSFGVRPD